MNIQRKTEWSNSGFYVSKDVAHTLLGHSNLEATMLLERQLGWKFTGTMHKYNSCCISNAKQKAMPKFSNHVPTDNPGTRFFLDLSIILKP